MLQETYDLKRRGLVCSFRLMFSFGHLSHSLFCYPEEICVFEHVFPFPFSLPYILFGLSLYLVVLGRPYGTQRIKSGRATFKASALSCTITPLPHPPCLSKFRFNKLSRVNKLKERKYCRLCSWYTLWPFLRWKPLTVIIFFQVSTKRCEAMLELNMRLSKSQVFCWEAAHRSHDPAHSHELEHLTILPQRNLQIWFDPIFSKFPWLSEHFLRNSGCLCLGSYFSP